MNRHTGQAAAALMLATVALAVRAEDPQAGQWSNQSAMSADGQHWKPLPPRQECLTPAQAQVSIEQRIQQMVSQAVQSGCRALEVKASGGRASGRFECQQPGAPALIDVQGSYSAQRYERTMTGTNLADRNGSGVVVPKLYMRHEGRHVGACAG